ncbi:hypothetical protein [Paenibacillus sp. N3.4]|uniref:hypothetical protein n=1 Tax=Paenibacillus sp. N3.4 TaxID=2603222 RepID=UPI0011C976DA|nr:hypothetical protein [Paenibacillus sp. N3.4]TXK84469.1 hypothetical protein FU659_08610 [Paenibacillus sp. N3.4]
MQPRMVNTGQRCGETSEGTTTSMVPKRAVVKTSKFAYASTDYNLEFTAQGDRFRMMFRYSSSTSYYFLEFKNANSFELWNIRVDTAFTDGGYGFYRGVIDLDGSRRQKILLITSLASNL